MRRLFRRYAQLTVPQKRLYSLLSVVTLCALLLYCLGIGSFVLRSRLVSEVAMDYLPTFTASSTSAATIETTPRNTSTPTATLPPTPTQRPIPTFTPTPESINITVVITSTEGLTSTMVISATVTPTPVLTATVTITAEASLPFTGTVEPCTASANASGQPPEPVTQSRPQLPPFAAHAMTVGHASEWSLPNNRFPCCSLPT